MIWLWISALPPSESHSLFTVKLPSKSLLTLSLHSDGRLELSTSGNAESVIVNRSRLHKFRWTHLTLVHYPLKSANPSIRLFIDGVLNDTLNWSYPGLSRRRSRGDYIIGDASEGDDPPRLIHHLGRDTRGTSKTPHFGFQAAWVDHSVNTHESSQDGLGIPEASIMFAFSPLNTPEFGMSTSVPVNGFLRAFRIEDWWAAVALRLVQGANTPHEISRALGVLTDGLRNSWQNSEDMERLRGYEILADTLRGKSQMINITGFETLFEFLASISVHPTQSTVVNTVAYRAIALDFELWSRTRKEIQQVYLEHFITVLQTSRYRKFNSRQRFAKMGLVRKLLFVLQTDWLTSPKTMHQTHSFISRCQPSRRLKGHDIPTFHHFTYRLHKPSRKSRTGPRTSHIYDINTIVPYKFAAASPLPASVSCFSATGPRLPLHSNPHAHRYRNTISPSFSRKFELISGWSVLKTVLPYCWDPRVNEAAFDVLLGRFAHIKKSPAQIPTLLLFLTSPPPSYLLCSQAWYLLRAIVMSLTYRMDHPSTSRGQQSPTWKFLLRKLWISMHRAELPSSVQIPADYPTFIEAYKTFVSKVTAAPQVNQWTRRILEKITHLGLALALDPFIAGSQKREILDTLQSADVALNPNAEKLSIDQVLSRMPVCASADCLGALQHAGWREDCHQDIARMTEWRKTIQVSERKRLRRTVLDLRETRRQVLCLVDWTHLLTQNEGCGLSTSPGGDWTKLKGHTDTEKLEPQNAKAPSSRVDTNEQISETFIAPEIDTASMHQVEVPPGPNRMRLLQWRWMIASGRGVVVIDDKHRRVRHELESGTSSKLSEQWARIAGVDSSPGLLIIGRTHLYMLDVELDGPQRAQRWSHEQIATYSEKTCLFRDVALEIYFKDSRSLLIVFLDKKKRFEIDHRLASIIGRHVSDGPLTPGLHRTPMLGRMGSKVLSSFRADELSTAQRKWQAREISNFTYLSILNQISGRTPSDATQYPVFPWVLKDYTSQTLDLISPDSYRDLTKPMGALTAARREAAETRYSNLQSVGEEPFHYGTHFSSSMIVCHFLIRLAPFTNMFKTLQGGDWDLPDRLFSDLPRAYDSAAQDVRGDVRELIPEFFTCPEKVFLENSANLDFGVQQNTGERIHDVKLPPWAREDPLLFIVQNRRALESSFVSEHLPTWIDLIWGCKQRDPESLNVFHPLSYEGSIDLDTITDELEREATVGIIHNFGQTPRKLFNAPHPGRINHGLLTLPVGVLHGIEEDPHLLVQGSRCFKDLGPTTPVRELVLDMIGEKIIPCREGVLCAPLHPHEQVEWRSGGTELRLVVDHRVVQVIENAFCNCAAFADSSNLVTGSSDYTVRLWNISRTSGAAPCIILSHIMRIHTDEVTCITASRTWSLVLSGSKDGSAALWDLNRGIYTRSIWHGDGGEFAAVNLVAINESTGYIATCSRSKLCLHTINARPMATLDLTTTPSFSPLVPTITAIAFHEREYSHLGVLATGGPDGSITLRTWTADGTPEDQKAQWEFVTIRAMKARMIGRGVTRPPSVTALKFLGETLVHGEETGKSYVWSLPD
ncbi:Beige 1 [Hypsizygus marmoreus]|uniref:Beige 1 n=1 Tax=Hypsizygus marmoreus TaxID=39966 RepID=A0A369JTE6_HYPMA|nr:Beige 1 [Hypsizygus marmoreus]